jgi:hypothetical protein
MIRADFYTKCAIFAHSLYVRLREPYEIKTFIYHADETLITCIIYNFIIEF